MTRRQRPAIYVAVLSLWTAFAGTRDLVPAVVDPKETIEEVTVHFPDRTENRSFFAR